MRLAYSIFKSFFVHNKMPKCRREIDEAVHGRICMNMQKSNNLLRAGTEGRTFGSLALKVINSPYLYSTSRYDMYFLKPKQYVALPDVH